MTHPSARARPQLRAFTLLELLVVLVILGLLTSLVAPKYFRQLDKSEMRTARAQIGELAKALDLFRLDTGRYPGTEPGLVALVTRPADEPRWNGPYLAKGVPLDPWGRPYRYRSPGEHGDFDLGSLGKDGVAGGDGDGADLSIWQNP